MGARLVGEAFAFGTRHDLTGNEARVLTYMALRALDTDTRPRYFGGREGTALALGYVVPDEVRRDDPSHAEVARTRAAAFRRVSEALTGLAKHHAIRELRSAHSGQRAEWELTLSSAIAPVDNCAGCNRKDDGKRRPAVDGKRRPEGDGKRPERATESVVPRNTEEPPEEKGRGMTSPLSLNSHAPVDGFELTGSEQLLMGVTA